ncbi:MAG TPA: zf-HC2 domain-containing protein, partial [Actinotalea sp.]
MSHLGSQLSALADGQLSAQAAENVLAHVAGCPECAAELAAARAARQVLASAFDVPVAPDLTRRLLALGATSGVPAATTRPDARRSPSRASVSRTSVPLPGARPAARPMPADCLHGDLGSGWSRPARWGSLALAGAAAASAALFVIGGLQPVVPDGQTAQALTVLGRAASDGSG